MNMLERKEMKDLIKEAVYEILLEVGVIQEVVCSTTENETTVIANKAPDEE